MFAELIDVRVPACANETVGRAVESLKSAPNWGLAPHALFTASKNVYRLCEEIAHRENILLTTHLAESREEMQMFHDAAGPLYEFLRHIGRPVDDCGNKTPLGVFVRASGDRALPHWIVAHLNELNETDFELLEKSALKFHIVHCPRSRDYFCHSQFPLERLRALGFNICLGTDSLASNDSLSLFDEMRAFQKRFPSAPPQETFRMVTVNPARALRQENELGGICPGFKADMIAVPCSGSADVFEQIIAFDEPVAWMMVNGKT